MGANRTSEKIAWENMVYGKYKLFVPEFRDFQTFMNVVGPRPEGYVLSRKDNTKPHGPDNSLWDTRANAACSKTGIGQQHVLRHGHCARGKLSRLYIYWRALFSKRRSVEVAPEWNDFARFLQDVGSRPRRGAFLLPKDWTKPMGTNNFYWSLVKRISPFARRNKPEDPKIWWDGRERLLSEVLAEVNPHHEFKIPLKMALRRLRRGWTPYKAVMTEPDPASMMSLARKRKFYRDESPPTVHAG